MGNIGDGIDLVFRLMFYGLIVSVPLAIWKLVDVVIWIFANIEIGIK